MRVRLAPASKALRAMNRKDPSPISRHGRAPNTRPKFHLIYYLLAAFDLLTVLLSLFIINRMTTIYTDSVEVNQV